MAQLTQVWSQNLLYLWEHRRIIVRTTIAAAFVSAAIAFLIPVRYDAGTTIMPPDQSTAGTAMLASILGHSGGNAPSVSGIASGLLGQRSASALYTDLLRSGAVQGPLIDTFHLQQVYGKRYLQDTAKKLNARTSIDESKKSGVITIVVTDNDRQRAREMAQAYVEQLNKLLARVSTSSAHREREFIEERLATVLSELTDAQQQLSQFSSSTSAIDIKEQIHAAVDAGAKLQAQLIVNQSDLESLKQIYGDDNVRVRAARDRVAVLQRELARIGGSASDAADTPNQLSPSLHKLPQLGIRYANLYRRVRVQEAVYDLLSAQYETARIQEAKDTPTVTVIDTAGLPEKKSYPHRAILMLGFTSFVFVVTTFWLLTRRLWDSLESTHEAKILFHTIRNASVPQKGGANGLP